MRDFSPHGRYINRVRYLHRPAGDDFRWTNRGMAAL